ncbi:MAG TPA: hypothetical protein VGY98_13205 [Verrucomicrobiae bacterium]|nr:hypothetical protein [Verrucomicrobiae bacterium]
MKISVTGTTVPERPLSLKRRQLKPERFAGDLYRSPREDHTQKHFVPAAMTNSIQTTNRRKSTPSHSQPKARQPSQRGASTLLLNRSNVKRKPSARGRTR